MINCTHATCWERNNPMASTNTYSSKTSTAGDAAVGGLFHGLVAGLVMAAYIALAGLLIGALYLPLLF